MLEQLGENSNQKLRDKVEQLESMLEREEKTFSSSPTYIILVIETIFNKRVLISIFR